MIILATASAVLLATAAPEDPATVATPAAPLPPETIAPAPAPAPSDDWGPLDLLSVLDLDFKLGPLSFHGYIQYEAAAYDQAPAGPPEEDFRRGGIHVGDPLQARDLNDGSNLRRARLGWEGSFGEHVAYRAMFELSGDDEPGESPLAEIWLSYNRAPWSIRAGALSAPTNMEGATSSDSTLFLERATSADLARSLGGGDGRLGVTVRRTDPKWMAAVSITGPLLKDTEDYIPRAAVIGRYTRAMTWRIDYRIHLGVNGTYVLMPGDRWKDGRESFPVRFLATPEVDVDDTPLIDTGDMEARHAGVFGLEFAAQRRNFYLQAEAFWFGVERHGDSPAPDPRFSGFYIQGSWILTGEARRFDRSRAAFWFPKPRAPLGEGGWGAWELAFRYSYMDLNDRAGAPGQIAPLQGVRGGEQTVWGAALLWYPRPRFRLMINWLHADIDRLNPADLTDPEPFGAPPSTPPVGVQIGQTLDVVAVRVRYSF